MGAGAAIRVGRIMSPFPGVCSSGEVTRSPRCRHPWGKEGTCPLCALQVTLNPAGPADLGTLLTPCPCLDQQQLHHPLCPRQGERMGQGFFLASGPCSVPELVPRASTSSGSTLGLLSSWGLQLSPPWMLLSPRWVGDRSRPGGGCLWLHAQGLHHPNRVMPVPWPHRLPRMC